MAQDLSVARAVFISSLLRSDSEAASISRDDATLFARTILKACNVCTTSHVKLCTAFIIRHVFRSSARTAALVKYLVILMKSCSPRDAEARPEMAKAGDDNEGLGKIVNGKPQQPPDPAFRRLHLLFLVHDALSHAKLHSSLSGVIDQWNSALPTLAALAACGCGGKPAKTGPHVLNVLAYWRQAEVVGRAEYDELQSTVLSASEADWETTIDRLNADEWRKAQDERRLKDGETTWIVPERHGVANDPTAPWHELPAANGLFMKRTRGYPLRAATFPRAGFPLRNAGKSADPTIRKDVNGLYNEVIRCYDKYTAAAEVHDVDALGNIIWKDPERPTRNYWGFTVDGVDKRKELAIHFADTATGYEDVRVDDAVERARALAVDRGRGMTPGRGEFGNMRGGWRGGRRW